MELQKQVTSLELSKRLEKLGMSQDSYFGWYETLDNDIVLGHHLEYANPLYSAYTVAELGELLPGNINGWYFTTQKGLMGNLWYCSVLKMVTNRQVMSFEADTEVEARGLLIEYLLTNNLLSL